MIRVFQQYVSLKSLCLMVWEGLLIALCVIGGTWLRFWQDPGDFEYYTMLPGFGIQVLVMVAAFQVCFYYNSMYDLMLMRRGQEQTLRLFESLSAACMLLGLLYLLVPSMLIGRGVFFISVALLGVSTLLSRVALSLAWRRAAPKVRVLVLGTGHQATTVAREISRRGDLNWELAGLVGKNGPENGDSVFGYKVLGSVEDLSTIALNNQIGRIIIALEDQRGVLPVRSLVNLRVRGIPVDDAHTALASLTGRVWLETVRPSWFVYSEGFRRSKLTAVLKRSFDLFCSVVGTVLTAPLMAVIATSIRLDSAGPVFYRQTRVGLGGRTFSMLKFRSMRTDAEEQNGAQWADKDDARVTRVGRLLRKYRLDELPQFLNVIRGDMSFVGPRPERPEFVTQLRERIPYYDERHSVRPGLTGWAQVEFHYGGTVEHAVRKLEYDLFYLQNMSLLFDCAILVRTVPIVLLGHGAR